MGFAQVAIVLKQHVPGMPGLCGLLAGSECCCWRGVTSSAQGDQKGPMQKRCCL